MRCSPRHSPNRRACLPDAPRVGRPTNHAPPGCPPQHTSRYLTTYPTAYLPTRSLAAAQLQQPRRPLAVHDTTSGQGPRRRGVAAALGTNWHVETAGAPHKTLRPFTPPYLSHAARRLLPANCTLHTASPPMPTLTLTGSQSLCRSLARRSSGRKAGHSCHAASPLQNIRPQG